MNRGTFNLSKYDYAQLCIGGKRVLLCGTIMAFDDVIENEVENIFKMLSEDFLGEEYNEEAHVEAVKEISYQILKEFERINNLTVKYQDEELWYFFLILIFPIGNLFFVLDKTENVCYNMSVSYRRTNKWQELTQSIFHQHTEEY